MKTSYLKQLIMQAYVRGYFNNKDNGWSTWDQIKSKAEDYANIELDFLDLKDKENVG